MGADKAMLSVDDRPLWSRQLDLLRELNPQAIFVSARARPAWAPAEVEVVLDEAPSRGPLSGIVATLGKIRSTHLLVLAVDLPRMETAHLRMLWSRAKAGRGIAPKNGDQFEPLCAIYPKGASALARASLVKGEWSLQSLAHRMIGDGLMDVYDLSPAELRFYHNANTPADLIAS